MITDIKIEFKKEGKFQEIIIKRKVNLKPLSDERLRQVNLNQFQTEALETVNPMYPVMVPASEGTGVKFECLDKDGIIELDQQTLCRITITYGKNFTSKVEFPFTLSKSDFEGTINNLTWLRPN